MKCEHKNFKSNANVTRLTDEDVAGAEVRGFHVDLQVECADCNQKFAFVGCEKGYHFAKPTTNLNGTILCVPIVPAKFDHEILGHTTQ